MRKLLLATSALLGASVGIAGVANAATLTPNAPNPAPGSITVTLNALVEAFGIAGSDTASNGPGFKSNTYGVASYARLYPSFDGVLANGLKYGGSIELRQYSGNVVNNGQYKIGAESAIYVQREFIYVGADKFGKLSLGTPVQPSELFQTGNEVAFNTGGWDGDLPGFFFGGGLHYFMDDDHDRNEKAVYVSPQVAGFDFGISFEPGESVNNFGGNGARVSSTTFGNNLTGFTSGPVNGFTNGFLFGRRTNTVDGAVRYQGAFGPVGLKANVAASYGGHVHNISDNGTPRGRNFSLYGGGIAATLGGFEIGGHIDSGVYGDDLLVINQGATGTTAYIGGGQYTFGPFVVGANYYSYDSGQFKSLAPVAGGPTIGTHHGYGVPPAARTPSLRVHPCSSNTCSASSTPAASTARLRPRPSSTTASTRRASASAARSSGNSLTAAA